MRVGRVGVREASCTVTSSRGSGELAWGPWRGHNHMAAGVSPCRAGVTALKPKEEVSNTTQAAPASPSRALSGSIGLAQQSFVPRAWRALSNLPGPLLPFLSYKTKRSACQRLTTRLCTRSASALSTVFPPRITASDRPDCLPRNRLCPVRPGAGAEAALVVAALAPADYPSPVPQARHPRLPSRKTPALPSLTRLSAPTAYRPFTSETSPATIPSFVPSPTDYATR